MNIKKNLTKEMMLRLAMFIVIIGAATLFDVYFDDSLDQFEGINSQSETGTPDGVRMFFVNQVTTVNAKTSFQKNTHRKLQIKTHDKFIQKYHQLRNYQVFKAEVETQTTPLILSYHYLVFKKHFFTVADDEPMIA